VSLTTRTPRKNYFHHSPTSFCSLGAQGRWAFGAASWSFATFFRPRWVACFPRDSFLSSHFNSHEISSCDCSAQTQQWSCSLVNEPPPKKLDLPTRDVPGAYPVTLRVSKALTVLALQWAFWRTWSHFRHLRHSRHWYNDVGLVTRSPAGSWWPRPNRSCVTLFIRMFRDVCSSLTTLWDTPLPIFFKRSRTRRSSGKVKIWNLTPFFPWRNAVHWQRLLTRR